MVELILIIIVGLVFAKTSKHKKGHPILWAIVGVFFYFIGRVIISALFYGGIFLFFEEEPSFHLFMRLRLIELMLGILGGLISSYILGEICVLNIRKEINRK